MEVFGQTICITLVGMGLTLAAVGILLGAMIMLARRAKGPAAAAPGQQRPGPAIPAHQSLAEAEQAAAVAVAIALARAARQIHPTRTWHSASPQEDLSPWQGYARGQQLERRKTQQMLRW